MASPRARRIVMRLVALVAATTAAISVLGTRQHPALEIPRGTLGRHVDVGGIPIRILQAGSGPDVLLLHGSPGSIEDWTPIVDRLAPRFHVTAIDRPGHGYSGGDRLPHTPAENAHVARAVIRTLGLRDVVLVGHSYGGITGLALAVEEAPEIRAFVLVAPRAYSPVHVDALYRVVAVPGFGAGFAALLAPFIGPAHVEEGIRASFGPNVDAIPDGFVTPRAAMWTRPTVSVTLSEERVTLAAALDAMAPRYAEIRKPVVLICGEDDERAFRDAQRLAGDLPALRLVTLPRTGHYVQFAQPEAIVNAVAEAAGTSARH